MSNSITDTDIEPDPFSQSMPDAPELPDDLSAEQRERIIDHHRMNRGVTQLVGGSRRERTLLEEGHPDAERFLPLYEFFTTLPWRANQHARFAAVGEDPEEVSFWKPKLKVRPKELTDGENRPIWWPNKNRERFYEAIRTTTLTEENSYLSEAAWYVSTPREPVVTAFEELCDELDGLVFRMQSVPRSYAEVQPIEASWTFNRQGDYFRFRVGVDSEVALRRSWSVVRERFEVLPRQRPDMTVREILTDCC